MEKIADLLKIVPAWRLATDSKSISREFLMKDFMAAVQLIDAVATEAEAADHHPDVHLTGYRHLSFVLSTHSEGGLSEKDFALAAKIDALPKQLKN